MTWFNLRRITTSGKFIPQIDGLRFIAIVSVMLFHLHASLAHNGAIRSPFADQALLMDTLSKRGVQLFFVISGFILALPFASARLKGGPEVGLKSYFVRRLTRLEPPYIIALLFCAMIWLVARHEDIRGLLPHLLASMSYVHNIVYLAPSTINGVAWSLEVEIQFYLLVPLLTLVFLIKKPSTRRLLLGITIALAGIASSFLAQTPLQLSLLYYGNFFLAGFLFCDLYVSRSPSWERASFSWDGAALLLWPLVWLSPESIAHVLLPFLMVILFVTVFRGRAGKAVFSLPLITTVGGMCYSIYLLHFVLISSVGKITKSLRLGTNFGVYFALQCAIVLPIVVAACAVFFIAIERPCMDRRWPSKLWHFLSIRRFRAAERAAVQTN